MEVAKERLQRLREQQRAKEKRQTGRPPDEGRVLDELNMSEQDRLELRLKADLHQDILRLIKRKKFTPCQLEKLFDIPQPRVSELLRGKLSLLSVSRLLYYANLLGARADVKLKPSRQAAWQIRKLNSAEIV
ncbi:MAG: XRE family transcriptional regulator [Candidatus Angelobacter sp.]